MATMPYTYKSAGGLKVGNQMVEAKSFVYIDSEGEMKNCENPLKLFGYVSEDIPNSYFIPNLAGQITCTGTITCPICEVVHGAEKKIKNKKITRTDLLDFG